MKQRKQEKQEDYIDKYSKAPEEKDDDWMYRPILNGAFTKRADKDALGNHEQSEDTQQ